MKYAIIIPDGVADEPQDDLQGQTPLEAARIPTMDAVARAGVVGRSSNVPAHLTAGSAVATMSLLGYDPNENFTGRAPLEAAAQGIELGPEDWAIRCNLVTIEDQIMRDFTAGHVSTDEACQLLKTAQDTLGSEHLQFVPGVSYRNLLIFRGSTQPSPFTKETTATPPHDLSDKSVANDYPRGPGSDLLCDLMSRSLEQFSDHPVNVARQAAGKPPATNVWLWGIGRRPQLEPFRQRYGRSGRMITAVDLLRGLASIIGWDRIEVPGATGYTDTDYAAKGRYAIDALATTDIICVHVEATDEASHEGDVQRKIEAVQQIDQHIVAPLYAALQQHGDHRILISPDHPTPVRTKTHSHGFVPWTVAGTGVKPDEFTTYSEPTAGKSTMAFDEGFRLMKFFLGENHA